MYTPTEEEVELAQQVKPLLKRNSASLRITPPKEVNRRRTKQDRRFTVWLDHPRQVHHVALPFAIVKTYKEALERVKAELE